MLLSTSLVKQITFNSFETGYICYAADHVFKFGVLASNLAGLTVGVSILSSEHPISSSIEQFAVTECDLSF